MTNKKDITRGTRQRSPNRDSLHRPCRWCDRWSCSACRSRCPCPWPCSSGCRWCRPPHPGSPPSHPPAHRLLPWQPNRTRCYPICSFLSKEQLDRMTKYKSGKTILYMFVTLATEQNSKSCPIYSMSLHVGREPLDKKQRQWWNTSRELSSEEEILFRLNFLTRSFW